MSAMTNRLRDLDGEEKLVDWMFGCQCAVGWDDEQMLDWLRHEAVAAMEARQQRAAVTRAKLRALNPSASRDDVGDAISALRRVLQANHPDKGGDREAFENAMEALNRLRA